ncbi:MAG TPA: hypothetical protein VKP30_04795, partial [Polyangiaceae bacterium]|nr:hypothetical protein [Polyangiaceae bacterium]
LAPPKSVLAEAARGWEEPRTSARLTRDDGALPRTSARLTRGCKLAPTPARPVLSAVARVRPGFFAGFRDLRLRFKSMCRLQLRYWK